MEEGDRLLFVESSVLEEAWVDDVGKTLFSMCSLVVGREEESET